MHGLGAAGDDDVGEAQPAGARRRWRSTRCSRRTPRRRCGRTRGRSRFIEIAAAGAFGMSIGTRHRQTRRGPFSLRVSQRVEQASRGRRCRWRSRRRGARGRLGGCRHPPRPRAPRSSANWRGRVETLGLGALEHRLRGERLASAAKVTGSSYFSTQSCSSVWVPDSPASSAVQLSGAVPPSGDGRADAGDDDLLGHVDHAPDGVHGACRPAGGASGPRPGRAASACAST